MTRSIRTSLGFFTSATVAAVFAGCAGTDGGSDYGADSSEDTASSKQELVRRGVWFRHRFPPPRDAGVANGGSSAGGGTAGTTGSGANGSDDDASCSVCAKAQACCTAVQAGALCTFSQATCESLAPSARVGYLQSCAVLLDTVRSVRSELPSSCR
jgi:hypothetical protein